jgi:cell division protein FtsB
VSSPARPSITGRAFLLALVLGGLLLALAVPVRGWIAQRAEIAGLRADVEAAQVRVAELQVQSERWQDPAFVAAEARRRLHFVLPGEVGYITLGSQAAQDEATRVADEAQPWYSSLWSAVREADAHAPGE